MGRAISSLILILAALAGAAGCSTTGSSSRAPESWDGLQKVAAKGLDLAYVLPGADFTTYSQVMLEPVEVEFDKNWLRDQNSTIDLSRQVDAADVKRIRSGLADMVHKRFSEELSKNGYAIVQEPSASTLHVSAAIADLYINAPDIPSAGRVRTYTTSAGSMTLVVDVRDAVTGKLLARAVDRADDADASTQLSWTTSVSNEADADIIIRGWARRLRQGLDTLTGRNTQ
jgi:hypothetical protein